MYKDKDKQRKAVKLATQRYRLRKQGITQKVSRTQVVIPEVQAMVDDVQVNGGEYAFTTNKGKIRDVHRTPPKSQSYNPMMVGYIPPSTGD